LKTEFTRWVFAGLSEISHALKFRVAYTNPTACECAGPGSFPATVDRLKRASPHRNANHNAYYSAALHDRAIAAVAPTGEAWQSAWSQGVANPNPDATSALPSLWYGINPVNNPAITSPDYLHPSVYGAYLSGLVLFQQITGVDVRQLGGQEIAAQQLGIASTGAVQLQMVAWQTVAQESSAPINQTVDPCTLTH